MGITWNQLKDRAGHARPLLEIDLEPLADDPNTVALLLEISVDGCALDDCLGFEWNRQECLNWLKEMVRKFDPTVEEQILDELRAVREKLSG